MSIVTENRVETINNFLIDLDDDLNRGLYISSYRALFTEIYHITTINGSFVDNTEATFKEILINGTIKGNSSIGPWIANNTLHNWTQRMWVQAGIADIGLRFNISSLRIYQENPWQVVVELNLTIGAFDNRNVANFTYNRTTIAVIDIVGFEDPLYAVYTNQSVLNHIIRAPFSTDFVINPDIDNNTDRLENHSIYSYYINHTDAPSFLMRIQGDLGADPDGNGIESLIYPLQFLSEQIEVHNRTLVDYLFFKSSVSDDSGNKINTSHSPGAPDWIRIDPAHYFLYNVTGIMEP